jgi:hypothetical protein
MRAKGPEMPPVRADGLQIDEDRRLQERIWFAERVSHGAILLLVLAAVAGLAGSGGILARGTIATAAGTIDHPRILRWETAEDLTVRFEAAGGDRSLRLVGPLADRVFVEAIQPDPRASRATAEGVVYDFAAEAGAFAVVTLRLRASRPGVVRLGIGVDDAPAVEALIVVLP